MTVRGALVDCGSGHTGVICYSHSNGTVNQQAKASVRRADGSNLALTDVLRNGTSETFGEFFAQLEGVLASLRIYKQDPCATAGLSYQKPDILYVGATGGVREAVENGQISSSNVEAFRAALETAFSGCGVVKFEVLEGGQEASWELDAAQIIWGATSSSMFPVTHSKGNSSSSSSSSSCSSGLSRPIGLFSGGGQSMQLGRCDYPPLSFPFSTFLAEFEERQGAAADAWLDPAAWSRFEDGLLAKIKSEAAQHTPFEGCYVCTAMNHRAAMYSEFAETPVSAGEAATILRASLPQFRQSHGPLYERMMATSTYPNYPLARITAMHTCRLAATLENMFAPDAQLFFAKSGVDADGECVECEWTLGAFMDEAKAVKDSGSHLFCPVPAETPPQSSAVKATEERFDTFAPSAPNIPEALQFRSTIKTPKE